MPTGGKLVGAVLFAALAWYVTELIKPLLPEGTPVGMFSPTNAVIGFLMGWNVMGKGAGVSYRQSVGYGLTTVATILFWGTLLWAGLEAYTKSIRLRYGGPMEALQDMALMMVEQLQLIATQDIIVTLIAGGIVLGVITEFFARRWT